MAKSIFPEEMLNKSPLVRAILVPQKANEELFLQPKETGAQRETIEMHNRERFANHFNYADPYCGNSKTYDAAGDYNCGRCNQANGDECLLLKIKSIDRKAGSCEDWETINAGDTEMRLHSKHPEIASYGVAKNGKGFGCHRCPYASKAYSVDSMGRSLYCGKGDFRVFPTACCSLNGATTI